MRSTKAIQFRYVASDELTSLFEDFRLMCNDAIGIALKEKPRSRFTLIEMAYPRLKEYGLHTHYILSACEVAYSVYRNKDRKSDPYIERAFLKLDNQSYSLNHLLLRIPTTPRHFAYLTLKGSDYHLSFIDDPTLKRGSITITGRAVSIAFSKEIAEVETLGEVDIDVNERNVTASDTSGVTVSFDTSNVAELKERYRAIRAKIGRRTRRDKRISHRLYARYGTREKNRSTQGPPPGHEGNRSTGQREEARHRHGEAERHQEVVLQRQRSELIFQRPDELVDVQRASETARIQGEMGRDSCKLR